MSKGTVTEGCGCGCCCDPGDGRNEESDLCLLVSTATVVTVVLSIMASSLTFTAAGNEPSASCIGLFFLEKKVLLNQLNFKIYVSHGDFSQNFFAN